MDGYKVVPEYIIDSIARCLLPKVQAYFESNEGQKEFETWKQNQEKHETTRRDK